MGRLGLVLGKFAFPADQIDQSAVHTASLPPAGDASYGRYLTHLAGCTACHGANLGGAKPDFLDMEAPNITPAAIGPWTLAQFEHTMRTGRDPSGRMLADEMPWRRVGQMNDQELTALYAFLKTVPPVTKPNT
jgi:mono/diheme cytochrome c family protein